MPVDYGELTRRDQARLRAARRRAGLAKRATTPKLPPRDTRTVSDVRSETKQRERAKRDFPEPRPIPKLTTAQKRVRETQASRNTMITARGGPGGTSLPHPLAFTLGLIGKGQDMLADEVTTSVIQTGDALRGRGFTRRGEAKERAQRWEKKHPWLDAAAETFMDPFLAPDAISLARLLARKGKKPPIAAASPSAPAVIPPRVIPPKGVLFHGSPEGIISDVDPFHHTKSWEEGIGFYITDDLGKATGYGKGRTASRERREKATSAVTFVRLKPDAKVLDMEAPADLALWRDIARVADFSDADFDFYVLRQAGKAPTNKQIREELLTQLRDLEGSDALYGLEESLADRGIQATSHLEGARSTPHRVWIVKDKDALEVMGGASVEDLLPGLPVPTGRPGPPAGAEKIVEALPEAKRLRRQQEAGYSAERGKRTAKAAQARERAGGGEAGKRAARAEFAGELPKLSFPKLAKTFGEADSELRKVFQPQVNEMLDHITAHPAMGGLQYRIDNTQEALLKTMDGVTPTKSEIKLLESVFGEEAAEHFKWMRGRDKIIKALNLPRSLMASYDISRSFRQDLVALVRHPVIVGRNWPKMIKAGRDPEAARAMLEDIVANPRYDEAIEDGLALTDYRGPARTIEEDMIGAEYAEKIPIIGKGVRFSNRAFNVGGAKNRMDIYDLLMDHAEKQGKALTKTERRHLTNVINAQTGRGNLDFGFSPASGSRVMEQAGPLLTVGLFSPRLIAARVAFLNPVYYARLSGPARVEAMRSFLHLMAAGSAVLWAASQIPGVDVGMDPRSSDFGKIKAGNTRIDIWGGFQQYIVNGYRYAKKETKSTTTGHVTPKTREDILWNFASGKAAPIPAYLRDFHRGETFDRQPFDPLKSAAKSVVPLNFQNAYEGFKENPATGAASAGLGAVGFGMQTYPPATPEQLRKARQAERGPAPVREHEDNMAILRKAAKREGVEIPRDAVVASRRIRALDTEFARAKKKKGATLTPQEKARITARRAKRYFPEYQGEIDGYLAEANTEALWTELYEMLRREIRAPLTSVMPPVAER